MTRIIGHQTYDDLLASLQFVISSCHDGDDFGNTRYCGNHRFDLPKFHATPINFDLTHTNTAQIFDHLIPVLIPNNAGFVTSAVNVSKVAALNKRFGGLRWLVKIAFAHLWSTYCELSHCACRNWLWDATVWTQNEHRARR
ncbi:hypothetical protein BJX62DRAFT_204786 [Aspergillus germanicus]